MAPDDWAGRFWARTWCDPQTNHCETGDCGDKLECAGAGGRPPVTLAEITLKGWAGQDFYDLSLVDGFNVAATVSYSYHLPPFPSYLTRFSKSETILDGTNRGNW